MPRPATPSTTAAPLLSARSVVLSMLLGSHPDRLSSAQLTRAGTFFDIPVPTLRVALTRAVSSGDLLREDGDYVLGQRLLARQRRQDEAVEDAEGDWAGDWEMAVVVVTGRPGSERAALRDTLAAARLAELREGVWTRPDNLRRPPVNDPVLSTFSARPDDPAALTDQLWDLTDWASRGRALLERLTQRDSPARRLATAAELVRHLTTDPLLPVSLLPADWPGRELRTAYAAYQAELRELTH
ncbi:PaaX domain-containing protein, C- domain protein [Nocardioides sp. JQ2195]|uniref:PaaX family transcriptional regulator C-terminal domain-containing protein n=1 Tax=Nocardioides sp. JQ2195 TaxID=2592334 RepID=UPI00143E8009|nr:PaaX family transcriptional regulator C-terminal domain-containing protein [Nocardioides sp. JQ2195]QIX26654.1 PaaX domain-containing protein, C- domain protein [Nocardioides sp. JQ2195]